MGEAVEPRHAQAEALAVLEAGYSARVLEPSPPAVLDDSFADDPVHAEVLAGTVVAPVGGDLTWSDYVSEHPDLLDWAQQRWLVSHSLGALPDNYVAERTGLHRLATYVIAAARQQATTKFGLRWTLGGFGTPFFGPDQQVRVQGDKLVVQEGDVVRTTPITTLQAAADFIGSTIDATAAEHDSPPVGDINEELGVSSGVVDFLGDWWGMGTAALETVRADPESTNSSRVQLWPGHFDPAIEVGDEDRRGSYGASPGDAGSPEPYLYVSVWWPDRLAIDKNDPFWNADGYVGARLGFADLVGESDPVTVATDFYRTVRDRLVAS